MAVTKTSVVFVLVVLAITYNQGAARSVDSDTLITKNGLSSSEESQEYSNGEKVFMIPTVLRQGFDITINSTVDPNDSMFILELPSKSGQSNCKIEFLHEDGTIYISPAVDGYENSMVYCLNVSSGNPERQTFLLKLVPRTKNNIDMITMTFDNRVVGISSPLMCEIKSFEDIDRMVIKGVSHVNSLLFEFK